VKDGYIKSKVLYTQCCGYYHMSKIAFCFTIAIQRHARALLGYPLNANRLSCCFFSSNTNVHSNSWRDNMTDDSSSKTQLSDDALDDHRESKRMKFSSDSSDFIHPTSDNPPTAATDASDGVLGSVLTSPTAVDTHEAKKNLKLAKSIKRSTSVGYAKSGRGKHKDRKTSERRNRRGTRNEPAEGEDANIPKAPRLPKRQCALLIGFCGSGYSGMQMYACHNFSQLFLSSIFQSTRSYSND
jgi:hypothetical protein